MEELAEASIEDTDGAGLQPAIALHRPRGQVRQGRTRCSTAASSTPVPGLPRAKLHTAAQDFVPVVAPPWNSPSPPWATPSCALTPVVLLFLLSVGFKTSPRQ
ncbi:hypothetical protein GQ600_9328 [Phytophthora cactorum]|nr:hypothetical protein GQ600_9328 [Phytophthora cactorum]